MRLSPRESARLAGATAYWYDEPVSANPHPAGSDLANSWVLGWAQAQREVMHPECIEILDDTNDTTS